jgi:hypothetical protein
MERFSVIAVVLAFGCTERAKSDGNAVIPVAAPVVTGAAEAVGTRLTPVDPYTVSFDDGTSTVATNFFYDTLRKEKCSIHYRNAQRPAVFAWGFGYQTGDEVVCMPDTDDVFRFADSACSIPLAKNSPQAQYAAVWGSDFDMHVHKLGQAFNAKQLTYYLNEHLCRPDSEKSAQGEFSLLGEEVPMSEFAHGSVSVRHARP